MTSCSSAVVATLVPIDNNHDEQEDLNVGLGRRNVLEFRRHSSPLTLGRNLTTGISSTKLPKNTATISWKSDSLWLERHCSHCSVIQANGTVVPLSGELHHGDVVRLYKQEYAYRVQYMNHRQTENGDMNDNVALKETSEECMCAVCMEIMVHASAVVPCGHTFCKECVADIMECPNCRLPIQQTVVIKSMDNVICKLVESSQVFSTTDVEQYQSRIKPTTNTVSTLQPSPPKRARRDRASTTSAAVSVDLTLPRVGDTADDAICIDL